MRRALTLSKIASSIGVALAAAVIAGSLQGAAQGASRPAPGGAPVAAAHTAGAGVPDRQGRPLTPGELPLLASPSSAARTDYARPAAAALAGPAAAVASCTPADFGSKTGSALVTFVKASTVDCVNTLFTTGAGDANSVFREAQMVTVADAYRSAALAYTGTDAGGILQLVEFLRAGYYVQYGMATQVGPYGTALQSAIRGGLDAATANGHFLDVTDANGPTLSESVTLIDSAAEAARYLPTLQRVLAGYTTAWDAVQGMTSAANNVYTPLFRGHQFPEFVTAVTNDPSVLTTLRTFALGHLDLLGTGDAYLTTNAGMILARFLQDAPLQATVRPIVKSVLDASSISGPTSALWVTTAGVANQYDPDQCSYYGTCDLPTRLGTIALPITYKCDDAHTIRAQDMPADQLAATCSSLQHQDAYFHGIVADSGPVADDHNTNIQVVIFNSRTDYQTYGGVMFGVDTNAGGEYLEGNPATAGNQPVFVAYEQGGQVWNLNHEYTHYLDGRYDTYGDFTASTAVPDVWWIEGFAEYVSYSYRGVDYDEAITEAGKHTYPLSTLWQTTYDNTDQTRTYNWGYLAVRYMLEKHRGDVLNMLAKFRTGDYNGGYAVYATAIGTRYDADFASWLTACAAGACKGGGTTNQPPTSAFDTAVSGLTVALTDRSTDSDGSIAARSWNFGDGTTSTDTNPSKTYATAGSYTVTLTVTDNRGATATSSKTVVVAGLPQCTNPDSRVMGQNCSRANLSAAAGAVDYLYLYLPAGTSKLTVSTKGGTGNADLYYNADTWASPSAYTARSTRSGNTETLTVTNPTAGYRYVSLYAKTAFSGVTVSTQY
ncbi:collagenase [Kitasatospora nipponensis]|uniref:microbial collagenase n=1 Tax=Kitasatospora nipponensis TaxID=258049 RepID=A0ABP4GMI2_9ACTN